MTPHPARELLEGMPAPDASTRALLLLDWSTYANLRTRAGSLARRGYMGCLPFARTGGDDIVLRLQPGILVGDAPVGIAWRSAADGLTIAPRLRHFAAGRLAQLGDLTIRNLKKSSHRKALLGYAASLGGEEGVATLVDAAPKVKAEASPARRGALWMALKRLDVLFEALGGAWSFEKDELSTWLESLRGPVRTHPIVRRVRLGYHTRFDTGVDVSDDAWSVVTGDLAFDRSYSGLVRGTVPGSTRFNALAYAVTYLRAGPRSDRRFRSPLWAASEQAVDEPSYDGAAHLEAAMRLVSREPQSAYVQMANAASFAAGKRSAVAGNAHEAALNLSQRKRWSALTAVLSLQTA